MVQLKPKIYQNRHFWVTLLLAFLGEDENRLWFYSLANHSVFWQLASHFWSLSVSVFRQGVFFSTKWSAGLQKSYQMNISFNLQHTFLPVSSVFATSPISESRHLILTAQVDRSFSKSNCNWSRSSIETPSSPVFDQTETQLIFRRTQLYKVYSNVYLNCSNN